MTTAVARRAPEQVLYKIPEVVAVARRAAWYPPETERGSPGACRQAKPPWTAHLARRQTHYDRRS